MENLSIFDMLYENYKIKKPIRLIECFAGYGSQALALKYLGANFEHHKICEWATKSIQAYKDVHFTNDNTDYSKDLSQDEVINYLATKGVSMNYNEPMSLDQIKRKSEEWQRTTYNNIIATHNLVNISQVKGKDLEIVDTDKYDYILTYSFPCQDLSLAGKRAGMEKDSGTRSGLLWEIERILDECKELGNLPRILLMENVPEVVGSANIEHFKKWRYKLEQLGYSNYDKILNSKDYGIPQNRRRCFMVSILGEWNYSFPSPIVLKNRLKDLLETNVDEKFYLSSSKLEKIQSWGGYEDPLKDIKPDRVCSTITTHCGKDSNGMQLVEEEYMGTYEYAQSDTLRPTEESRTHIDNNISGTLLSSGNHNGVLVVGNYSPSNHNAARIVDENGIAPTVMENHGTVTEVAQNLKQQLCEDLIEKGKVKENDVIRHSYSTSRMEQWENRNVETNNISPTLDTRCDCLGVVVNDEKSMFTDTEKQLFTEEGNIKRYINSDIVDEFKEGQMATTTFPNGYGHGPRTHNESIALNTIDKPVVKQNLRIRKLTPLECSRLMGVKDEDSKNMAKHQSDASLWHLSGDSIVTTCIMAMFGEMLDIDWKKKLW